MNQITKYVITFASGLMLAFASGCASEDKKDRDFHTSGSREADQRAEQRVAKTQQLRGEGGDESDAEAAKKKSLYERLGGEKGVALIVEDWVNRAIADPRVNWERKGVKSGRWYQNKKSAEWQNTPEKGTAMKKHIAQFIANATGGPTTYEGGDMKAVHANMKISNAEFDAALGALQASMDNLKIATEDQKELLAVVESTRPQIATKR